MIAILLPGGISFPIVTTLHCFVHVMHSLLWIRCEQALQRMWKHEVKMHGPPAISPLSIKEKHELHMKAIFWCLPAVSSCFMNFNAEELAWDFPKKRLMNAFRQSNLSHFVHYLLWCTRFVRLKFFGICKLTSLVPTSDEKRSGHRIHENLCCFKDWWNRQNKKNLRGWFHLTF